MSTSCDARVGPVDLVDDDDRREPALERLAQHEPRLRQRPLGRVDEQHHAVDHRQCPLDFAAEVGVARRVDDVDEDVPVVDGGVLGQDGDAALALEVVVVHRALGHPLVGAEHAALMEQRIDQGGLAVIDVGDDRDVAPERVGDSRGGFLPRKHLTSITRSSRQLVEIRSNQLRPESPVLIPWSPVASRQLAVPAPSAESRIPSP